jgi:hypothetical protein
MFADNLLQPSTSAQKQSKLLSDSLAVVEETLSQSKKKTVPRKSFSDSLSAFFQESMEDLLDGAVAEVKRSLTKGQPKKPIGIELLLQKTLQQENDHEAPITRRLTLVLESDKIEQLKEIAREQKQPLKNILSDLVDSFLRKKK